MNIVDALAPLGLLLIGLAALFYILRIVWVAIFGGNFNLIESITKNLKVNKLEQIDKLFEAGKSKEAFTLIIDSFKLDLPKTKNPNVQAVYAHNIEVFRRLVRSTEGLESPVKEIPILEELIASRAALCKSWAEAHITRSTLKSSGPDKSWAFDEFNKRVRDLEDKLTTNSRSLSVQIDSLKQKMESSLSGSVTYH